MSQKFTKEMNCYLARKYSNKDVNKVNNNLGMIQVVTRI